MRAEFLDLIKLREERITFGGRPLIVRELHSAAEVGTGKDDPDIFYRLMVCCIYEAEEVTPGVFQAGPQALTVDDIPHLKAGSRKKLAPLIHAVQRVNGLDVEEEVKNSEAAQTSASSTA